MKHYVLCIVQDELPADIIKWLSIYKTKTSSDKYINPCYPTKCTEFLAKSYFISFVNIAQPSKRKNWKKLGQNFNLNFSNSPQKNALDLKELIITAADTLHKLANNLPNVQSFMLDVHLDGDLFEKLEPHSHLYLKEALYRLVVWHNASLKFTASIEKNGYLDQWLTYFGCKVSLPPESSDSNILWHGSINLTHSKPSYNSLLSSCTLSLYQNSSEALNIIFSHPEGKPKSHALSYCIETLGQLDCSKIPLNNVWPVPFLLEVTNENNLSSDALDFLQDANKKRGQCTLFRLALFDSQEEKYEHKLLTTEAWKAAVLYNKVKSGYVPLQSENNNYHYFILLGDGLCSNSGTLYLMHKNASLLQTLLLPYHFFQTIFNIQLKCLDAFLSSSSLSNDCIKCFFESTQKKMLKKLDIKDIMRFKKKSPSNLIKNRTDVTEHLYLFNSDGNGKEIYFEDLPLPKLTMKPTITLEELMLLENPHKSRSKFHDIYYSSDNLEDEIMDVNTTEVIKKYIPNETASFYSIALQKQQAEFRPFSRSSSRLFQRKKSSNILDEIPKINGKVNMNNSKIPFPAPHSQNSLRRSVRLTKPFECPSLSKDSLPTFHPPSKRIKLANLLTSTPTKSKECTFSLNNNHLKSPIKRLKGHELRPKRKLFNIN